MTTGERTHPDIIAARAVGIGVGLIALMVSWLAGNRIMGAFLEAPAGPTVAFTAAVLVGTVLAVVVGRRLAAAAARDLRQARPHT